MGIEELADKDLYIDESKYNSGNQEQGKEKADKDKKQNKNKIPINKYTANGRIPLHESVVIGSTPKFVTLNKDNEPDFITEIVTPEGEIFIPNDTIHKQNPLPYIFESEKEFKQYVGYAKKLDLDSLFSIVESEFGKYVNVEGYYYTLLVGNTIWSHFQDRFGYTHYIIIVGDNDSGKNSALLVFKYLGYRAFYVTSASAANYYTVLGNREEGQVTTAEDEAEDMAEDKEKRNVFKTGYATGGSVPKVELEGGRRSDSWLTYCDKWAIMEEIPDNKKMKGILDRSLVLKFITGEVPYNIKDVIRSGNDPEYEPLYNKLVHVRKILFCYRLLHHKDPIPNLKLNVKNRTAELTKPLIRLFNNSPLTKQRILDDLSKFINERNENKKNSFEAKLYNVITQLIEDRKELIKKGTLDETELKVLGTHIFSNEIIRDTCKSEMDGRTIEGKDTAFYSPEFGTISQKKITSILKSKFKVDPPKLYRIGNEVLRCVEFKQNVLDRIKSYYDTPDEIRVVDEVVTDATNVTDSGGIDKGQTNNSEPKTSTNLENTLVNEDKNTINSISSNENNQQKEEGILPESVTDVTSVTDNEKENHQEGESD
jgi:hypothetical protein